MYEPPAYGDLRRRIEYWKTVREYVDLARTVRAMSYGDSLTLESENGAYTTDAAHRITLRGAFRAELLKWLAQRYEDVAAGLKDEGPDEINVREACKM